MADQSWAIRKRGSHHRSDPGSAAELRCEVRSGLVLQNDVQSVDDTGDVT